MSCIVVKVKTDFYMEDGDISFTKGKNYLFIYCDPDWKSFDNQGDIHYMELADMQELDPNFIGECE